MPTRKPETIWKLIECRCAQISDAAAGVRVPFLLSLSWAFLWAWGLFTVEFGYVGVYADRYQSLHQLSVSSVPEDQAHFARKCGWLLRLPDDRSPTPDNLAECKRRIEKRLKWAEVTQMDNSLVTFPGGFPKTHISDLGIVGNAGLILILAWLFYTSRRQNHAICAMVDRIDGGGGRSDWRIPETLLLVPQDPYVSAEHLAYAYHSVAQRFVFLSSTRSMRLLLMTSALLLVPAGIASLNLWSDLRSLTIGGWERWVYVSCAIQAGLLGWTWFMSLRALRFLIDSSVLLNAWSLAVRDVWLAAWDESTDDPATIVHVDRHSQRATVHRPPPHAAVPALRLPAA